MSQERYIAAIEISSSKIIGAVGISRTKGELEIIAVEQEKGVEFVRYGQIQNLEETANRVARVLDRLEQHPKVTPRRIKSLYVGLSGISLRSIPVTVRLNLADDSEITDDILNRLSTDARNTAIDTTLTVVDAVPRIYRVGKTETHSPKGMVGNEISATFDLIVCRRALQANIMRTLVDKLHLNVESFVVTALACGHLIVSNEEMRLGCMLVDMGAETTTVTIYSHGCLQYFATLPLGGRNITRDLTSLSLLEEKAEDIKITSGNAIAREPGSGINLNGLRPTDISNIVVARAEEIVANIMEQVTYAGLTDKDIAGGIVCIGGGSRLEGMSELLGRQSGLHIHTGQLPPSVTVSDNRAINMELTEVASVLFAAAAYGHTDCLELPRKEQMPPTGDVVAEEAITEVVEKPRTAKESSRLLNKLRIGLANLFAPAENSDDSDLLDE